MLVTVRTAPCVRPVTKYHNLSLISGPPVDAFTSQAFCSELGATSPAALSSVVKLSPCIALFDPLEKKLPCNVLPPVFGTKFMIGPLVSASPRPPDVVTLTSCALPGSVIKPDVVPASEAPWPMPSTCTRPSLLRPCTPNVHA